VSPLTQGLNYRSACDSGHVNYYKVVYCLTQKIYRQPLKKISYHTTRLRFLAQGQGQISKALSCKAKAEAKAQGFKAINFGLMAKVKAYNNPEFKYKLQL